MRHLPATLILCLGLPLADDATAQEVHRCMGADGTRVLTDRRCADVGASEQPPIFADDADTVHARLFRDGCSRTLSDLVRQIASAIASKDVNGLAGIYEWSDVSNAGTDPVDTDATARLPHPVGLRLEQTQADGHTPAHAEFALNRRYGCFWIRL